MPLASLPSAPVVPFVGSPAPAAAATREVTPAAPTLPNRRSDRRRWTLRNPYEGDLSKCSAADLRALQRSTELTIRREEDEAAHWAAELEFAESRLRLSRSRLRDYSAGLRVIQWARAAQDEGGDDADFESGRGDDSEVSMDVDEEEDSVASEEVRDELQDLEREEEEAYE